MLVHDQQHTGESKEHLIHNLQNSLNRYCLSLTGSRWDAEDLAQDTWIKVLPVLLADGQAVPEALLLRIARNTWIDIVRRRSVYSRLLAEQSAKQSIACESGRFETERVLHALIRHLSPLQRAVLLLRDVLGYSAAETSRLLDTSEGAAKAALHRARLALPPVREELAAEGPPLPDGAVFAANLRAMALAYEQGELEILLQLIQQPEVQPQHTDQQDEAETVDAVGHFAPMQTQGMYSSQSGHAPVMRMAA
ncbi:RNA polymerase sigma factor [Paenibacillus donghaensis]|nr:RNA polymerase sigma factor [Paenibacillus donghaensis]